MSHIRRNCGSDATFRPDLNYCCPFSIRHDHYLCHLICSFPNPTTTMENGPATQGEGRDPSGFLSQIIGNPVTVKLNSGVVYKGN